MTKLTFIDRLFDRLAGPRGHAAPVWDPRRLAQGVGVSRRFDTATHTYNASPATYEAMKEGFELASLGSPPERVGQFWRYEGGWSWSWDWPGTSRVPMRDMQTDQLQDLARALGLPRPAGSTPVLFPELAQDQELAQRFGHFARDLERELALRGVMLAPPAGAGPARDSYE